MQASKLGERRCRPTLRKPFAHVSTSFFLFHESHDFAEIVYHCL